MSICLCLLAYLENDKAELTKFLCLLPVAVSRSSSDRVAISYILLVSWMTCFRTVGPVGQYQLHYILMKFARCQHQLDVTHQCLVEFIRIEY